MSNLQSAVALANDFARAAFLARRAARIAGDAETIARAETNYAVAMQRRALVENAAAEMTRQHEAALAAERAIYEAVEAECEAPVDEEAEYEAYLAKSAIEAAARRDEEEANDSRTAADRETEEEAYWASAHFAPEPSDNGWEWDQARREDAAADHLNYEKEE